MCSLYPSVEDILLQLPCTEFLALGVEDAECEVVAFLAEHHHIGGRGGWSSANADGEGVGDVSCGMITETVVVTAEGNVKASILEQRSPEFG